VRLEAAPFQNFFVDGATGNRALQDSLSDGLNELGTDF